MPDPKDPNVSYRFAVEIAGIQEAFFTECSGIESKIEVEEYKEGGLNEYVHKLPGRRSFGNLTLKRGMTHSTELWDWFDRVVTKKAKSEEKKNISVIGYDVAHKPAIRWDLIGAYPIKWSPPTFASDQSGVMLETLELAFQEFTVKQQ